MREFRNSGSVLLILFASYCVTNTSTFALNADEDSLLTGSPNGKKVLHRSERDADIKHEVALKVNNLNDTHQQLIVHWVGEGSSIIICLARDAKEANRRAKMPSAVYYSYDYGETFENKSDLFKVPNGTLVQLDKFYIHTKFPSRTIFTDSTNKMIFTTEDHGKNFKSRQLTFTPNDVSILQSSVKIFLIHDKTDPMKRLHVTHDFGATWTVLQDYVKSYDWFSEDGSDRKQLIVQREEKDGLTNVLKLKSWNTLFSMYSTEVLINSVIELSIKGDYIFATKNNNENSSVLPQNKDLFIKFKSSQFMKTTFPTVLPRKDYFIADITENRIMVIVNHGETHTNLYVSDIVTEKTSEVHFSLSLERIFCLFPNSTWRYSLISALAESNFADLHKVDGLRGIYIASVVLPTLVNASTIGPEHLVSRITFNWGVTWHPVNLTQKQGSDLLCQPTEECSLHLSQKFTLMHPTTRQMSILSSKSAPGIIIATGVFGRHMKGIPSVYMSRDGGVTFKQVLKENAHFNMGDHGGIIVAIKYRQKQNEEVSYIMYSTDMGETWKNTKLSDSWRIYSLMTEPGENTTVFSLFGSPPGNEHNWVIVKADFQKVFHYNCTEDDFKTWTPYNPDEHKMNCVLGRKEVYKRRRTTSQCYIGLNVDHPVKAEVCPCDRTDYTCDDGFYWDVQTEHCIRNKTSEDVHYTVPKNCPPLTYFHRTKGYKKTPGDVCEGGLREYEYDMIPCPLKEQREFLLLAQKDRIVRFLLENPKPEVLPLQSLQNVIAIEYDTKTKCVFYADIVTDVISKWCMDNASLPQTVVDSHLHSVEGMAYDWISHHLYFVDGVRAKIEVVRTDVDNSNRYRRTVINSTIARKPRGIAVHPVAGYMFWTDWISGAPGIYRACLDGSDPKVLFSTPAVEWPNGITVDFIAERIYWVDAKEDYIASSDFFGKGFKKVIQRDHRVSHPFSVAVFKDNMYWDDWRANAIFVADKDHGQGIDMISGNLPGLMDLKIYAHSIQEGVNGCVNSTCSHMCFGLPNNKTVCACPDQLTLVDGHKCVCPGGQEPKNGACTPVQHSCAANFFRCDDGNCIPDVLKCDGEADCKDHSDELHCGNLTTCEPNNFRCGNGKCILANWRCDHDFDCPDQSDEIGCRYPSCKPDQFACDNGRCISIKWHCDFENDCRDGSDERNCSSSSLPNTCQADEFKCPGKNGQCIPASWQCDNEPDCLDGADEKNCTLNECDYDKFQCANSKRCIFLAWKCDGEDDCGDGSDEENCTRTASSTEDPLIPPIIPAVFPCNRMTFHCYDKKSCVPLAWKCDRVRDCGDGSDEIGCGIDALSEPKVEQLNQTDATCGHTDFTCVTGKCVPQSWVCDRVEDCPDGSDEKFCNGIFGCRTDGTEFRCRRSNGCIDRHLICNGVKDCLDGSDESICFNQTSTITPLEPCLNGFFRCDLARCEPLHKKCDGMLDCIDETDEQNCTNNQDQTYQATQLVVDKTFDEGAQVTWIVKPSPPSGVTLEYLPSISNSNANVWKNTTLTKYTYSRFDNLMPYDTYNVTIYVHDAKLNKTYPPAFYLKFMSGRGVPSPPRDVRAKLSSVTSNRAQIDVTWSPPVKPNGVIQQYFVNVEPPYPPESRSVPGNLRKIVINTTLVDNVVEYKITVVAKNEIFESADSASFSILVGNRGLKKVADLRADSPTSSSITLKWKPQKPNLNYTIDVSVSSLQNNSYPEHGSHFTNDTSYTVTGLSPGVRYVFVVTAIDGNFVSEEARVQASTIGSELPIVSNVSTAPDKSKNGNVVLRWDPINEEKGKLKHEYGVYYGVNVKSLAKGPKNVTNSTSISLYDLNPCTSYLFDVGVVLKISSEAILGPLSGRPAQFLTSVDVTAPPANVRITPDASAQPNITITWTASCAKVDRPIAYVIHIVENNTREAYAINVNASTDFNFTYTFGAKFGSHYRIAVVSTSQRAEKKWVEFETNRIPPPSGVWVTPLKKNEAMAQWFSHDQDQSLKNVKYSYEVLVCEGDRINVDAAKIYSTNSTSIFITDLQDNQLYSFAVRIVMPDGRRSELSNKYPVMIRNLEEDIATDSSSTEKQEGGGIFGGFVWLFIICAVVVSSAAGFLYWKRKRSHINSFKNLANSHYNTRSGSTTFSGVNGLDLDDTPDIREHFSDDEPLVIA